MPPNQGAHLRDFKIQTRDFHASARFGDISLVEDVTKLDLFAGGCEQVGQAENFALQLFLILHTLEVSTFNRGVVANVRLLLFVDLARIHDFFDCASRDQAEDLDIPSLTKTVCTILSLKIICWVPVWIDDDNFVCGSDVEAKTTGFRGYEKDEGAGIGVELIDNCLDHMLALDIVQDAESRVKMC